MGTLLEVFEAVFFLAAVVGSILLFSVFQAQAAYVTALTELWRSIVGIRALLFVEGLAAPGAPGEGARGTPGVEVTSGEMPGMVRSGRQNIGE